jgi:hypothetical protein
MIAEIHLNKLQKQKQGILFIKYGLKNTILLLPARMAALDSMI